MVIGMQWIIFIGVAVVSWLVQLNLQNKFKKFSKVPMTGGMKGREVALKMLHDNGIYDVTVTHTPGHLTDHYNPMNKTVNLSESVYSGNSIMAAAVAAHECGHAVQHARAYAPLKMRSARCVVCFAVDDVAALGRHPIVECLSRIAFGRHRFICHDNPVQLHHPSGGNQCQSAGLVVVEQFRPDECVQSRAGRIGFACGSLYLCSSRIGFIGHVDILHHDIYGPS